MLRQDAHKKIGCVLELPSKEGKLGPRWNQFYLYEVIQLSSLFELGVLDS
jgi:hypothetical protein